MKNLLSIIALIATTSAFSQTANDVLADGVVGKYDCKNIVEYTTNPEDIQTSYDIDVKSIEIKQNMEDGTVVLNISNTDVALETMLKTTMTHNRFSGIFNTDILGNNLFGQLEVTLFKQASKKGSLNKALIQGLMITAPKDADALSFEYKLDCTKK